MDKEEMLEIAFNDADSHVSTWLDLYLQNEANTELNNIELKTLFEFCGATDKIDPELRKKFESKHYGNASRSEAIEAVWGGKYKEYRKFCNEYVKEYEKTTGKELPKVKITVGVKDGDPPKFTKTSGMKGFFADLTAYAFAEHDSDYPFETLDKVTRARLNNGKAREDGTKTERFRIKIEGYNKNKEFESAGFPPDFPEKALSFIRTWSSVK